MNQAETIFSAISGIRSEYIEQAAEYRSPRKNSILRIGSIAAAACLVICTGILGVRSMLQAKEPAPEAAAGGYSVISAPAGTDFAETETQIPREEAMDIPNQPKAALASRKAAASSVSEESAADEMVPGEGEVEISPGLLAVLQNRENPDAIYAIDLHVFYHNGLWESYLNEAHDRFMQCWEDPAIRKYESTYEDWLANIYHPSDLDIAMMDKGADLSPERFAEYWNETASAEDREAYDAASKRRQQAWDAYLDRVCDIETEQAKQAEDQKQERMRLAEAGIEVSYDESSRCLRGFLTGDQILHFPANPSFGYRIIWTSRDAIADE